MSYIVKRANIEDLKAIQELNDKLFELEYEKFDPALKVGWSFEKEGIEYFTEMLTNQIVFIGIDNNKIVGYLAGSLNIENSYVTKTLAEIDNMYVSEEYRRSGLGTNLITKFKEYCKEFDIQEIKVTASSKNCNAIKFYKKNGFEDFEYTLKMKLDKEE